MRVFKSDQPNYLLFPGLNAPQENRKNFNLNDQTHTCGTNHRKALKKVLPIALNTKKNIEQLLFVIKKNIYLANPDKFIETWYS